MSLIKGKRVLVVEDTTIAATYLARELTTLGADVVGLARSQEQALEAVEKYQPDLILMDIHLSEGSSGIQTASQLHQRYEIPLIFTTSYSDDATLSQAMETSPYGYIVKPFDTKTIKTACETALHRFALEQRVAKSEKRFKMASEAAQFGVVELRECGQDFEFSGASSLQNRFGASTSLSKERFLALFPAHDRQDVINAIESGSSLRKTIKVMQDDSEPMWIDVVFSDVSVADNKVMVGAVIDVTERQRKMRRLKLSNVILDQLAEGVAVLDANFVVRDANRALTRLFASSAESLTGSTLSDFGLTRDALCDGHPELPAGHVSRQKISLVNAQGHDFSAFVTCAELEEVHGELRYVVTVSDITELSHAEKRLETLAFTDPLTGAGNRNYLKLVLSESVYAGHLNALIFIDIDSFKLVNDTYGHDVGDEVLAACAERIKQEIRREDIFIRHGGDEFVVLVQSEQDVDALCDRILATFTQPIAIDSGELKMSASIGVAESADAGEATELLKRADIAMYEAKKRGKNQAVRYSQEQNDAIEYRLYVEQGLYNALTNKELHATFQPIVDSDRKIVALEALCRWHSQDIGNINPASFIPVAEETGLINALGLKMLREVCIAHRLLRESGHPTIKLHVNVSILQLNSAMMVQEFLDYLADFGVAPEDLVLEVTESAMHDFNTRKVLKELSQKGFGIAIDDFGAGYASVSELTEPFTTVVKLDKSLAPSSDSTSKQNIIAESLVNLCHRLDKKVLFEGIESEAQAEFATRVGSHYMQGYLFARPMSLVEVVSMLDCADQAVN